jgi:SHOCT-like protein
MNENRRRILEMLASGQINADQAERLIAALEKEPPAASPGDSSESRPKAWPKYLRVVVEAEEGLHSDGPAKVNVRVPMELLRAGVKLASIIPPQARVKVNEALHGQGIELDLSQITPENLEELIYQLKDLTVDVGDKNNKVKVFCE